MNDCSNRFDFISTTNSIPTLNLDITKHPDSIRQEMNSLYGENLCKKCAWIIFKLPFSIEGEKGFLKIMVDFDYPYCENCAVPIRLRYYFNILINRHGVIFAENEVIMLDSLYRVLSKYLSKVGVDENYPETFKEVNYKLTWEQETERAHLDSALTFIYKAHLDYVESKIRFDQRNFCDLNNAEIEKLKEKYPLRIEFDLGKNSKLKPSGVIKVLEVIDDGEDIDNEFKVE